MLVCPNVRESNEPKSVVTDELVVDEDPSRDAPSTPTSPMSQVGGAIIGPSTGEGTTVVASTRLVVGKDEGRIDVDEPNDEVVVKRVVDGEGSIRPMVAVDIMAHVLVVDVDVRGGQLSPLVSVSLSPPSCCSSARAVGTTPDEATTSARRFSSRRALSCALRGVLSRPRPSSPSRSSSSTGVTRGAIIAFDARPGSLRGGRSRLCRRGGNVSGFV